MYNRRNTTPAVVSKETFHSRPSLKIHFQLKSFEVKKRKRRNSPLPGEYLNPSCCYIAYVLISWKDSHKSYFLLDLRDLVWFHSL